VKITDLQTYLVDTKGLIKWVFVKLTTDEGLIGYGEAGSAFRERAQAAAIQELKPLVLGRDPFQIRALWSHVYKSYLDVRGPSSLHVSALGAVEFAMWDIVGKALNTSVSNLLGGRCRDAVRAYLHAQVWGGHVEPGPDVYVQLAQERVAEGFSAIKFDPFWFAVPSDANISRDELRRIVKIVSAVREAVGAEVPLVIDLSGLEYMTSKGLRALTMAKNEAKGAVAIRLAAPNATMRRILAISRYDMLFPVVASVDAAS